ncbi:MAG TPA: hypothetical protein VM164_04530 [Burkholderiales bacterium]|nr:hypothetical protein [Burkholderiales bacterium]
MNTKLAASAICIAFLSGCAGSANHPILSAHEAEDDKISCSNVDGQILKAQAVIDGVNKDKSDVTGADVIDTLLWFPFNLIAKSINYKDALEAADRRIARLQELKKVCKEASAAQVPTLSAASKD